MIVKDQYIITCPICDKKRQKKIMRRSRRRREERVWKKEQD